MRNSAGKSLLKLLEEERRALLAGDISLAARLSDRKSSLLERFDPDATDRTLLAEIGARATSNQGLLDAVRRGIETARERIAAIVNAGPGDTYSVLGEKQPLRASTPSLHKRA